MVSLPSQSGSVGRTISSRRALASARSLAGNRSLMIGLLYDNLSPSYVMEVQAGVLEACEAQHYSMMVQPLVSAAADFVERVEEILPRLRAAAADAENEAPLRQIVEDRDLLGEPDGIVPGQHHHHRAELRPARADLLDRLASHIGHDKGLVGDAGDRFLFDDS